MARTLTAEVVVTIGPARIDAVRVRAPRLVPVVGAPAGGGRCWNSYEYPVSRGQVAKLSAAGIPMEGDPLIEGGLPNHLVTEFLYHCGR